MRRKQRGQSLVEMAFVLPVLLLVVLGIIDLSYYIYCYITVYQTVRDAAEEAAKQPPFPTKVSPTLNRSDPCVSSVITRSQPSYFDATLMDTLSISYPGTRGRALGQPVRVSLTYNIQPLTPLWNFVSFGTNGVLTVRATTERTIENLGINPITDSMVACSP